MATMSPNRLRALKILVVGMGILIVAGMAVIAVTLVMRASDMLDGSDDDDDDIVTGGDEADQARPTGSAAEPWVRELAVPPGGRIVDVAIDDGQALFVVETADGGQQVIYFDVDAAAVGGRVNVTQGE